MIEFSDVGFLLNIKVIDQGLHDSMSVFQVAPVMIEMVFGGDIEPAPIPINHFIGSEIIVVPSGKDELGFGLCKRFKQILFVLFGPTVVIVHIAAMIRRVAIDDVAFFCNGNGFPEIGNMEIPFVSADNLLNISNLVTYLGDVSGSKTVGFLQNGMFQSP